MKALRKKWNSCQGASILLALLFLLVCMMVGASIVMAAASNMGKIDSNKKEQQKYLTLASALNLLCDELENAQYVGQYDYLQEPCKEYIYIKEDGSETIVTGSVNEDGETVYTDSDGNEYTDGDENNPNAGAILRDDNGNAFTVHDQHRTYIQKGGALTLKDGTTGTWLSTVLPLVNDLDYIFANQFYMPENRKIDGDAYDFKSLLANPEIATADKPTAPKESYTLTFTMTLGDSLTEDQKKEKTDLYGDLLKTVRIKFEMWEDGRMELTATLMEGNDPASLTETEYVITAVMVPENENWRQRLLIPGNHDATMPDCKTSPVKWEREYIAKGEEAASNATP